MSVSLAIYCFAFGERGLSGFGLVQILASCTTAQAFVGFGLLIGRKDLGLHHKNSSKSSGQMPSDVAVKYPHSGLKMLQCQTNRKKRLKSINRLTLLA